MFKCTPLPPGPLATLEAVASLNPKGYRGCLDVLAWNGDRTVFFEGKRHRRDRIRGTQLGWVRAGLAAGLVLTDFVVVEWDFQVGEEVPGR